ncbi:MAG TPA: PilZ domain-containing protein [Candidatus Omnitrophota bacterium]|nr:PilZ domain-containing protein [Candidatus Omnitrophota bacterium]
MSQWDGLNRRRFPRVKFPCLVVIHQKEGDSKETILCHTENVGVGGTCIIIKQHVKLFAPVDIELDLMDMKEHVKCKGKVVWNIRRRKETDNKPLFYDIGIEFVDIKPADHKRIEDVIIKLVKEKKDSSYIV